MKWIKTNVKSLIVTSFALAIIFVIKSFAVGLSELNECYSCDVVYTGYSCPLDDVSDYDVCFSCGCVYDSFRCPLDELEQKISSLESKLRSHETYEH